MKNIDNLPASGETYASFDLVEFERRTATAPGVYTSSYYRYCNYGPGLTFNLAAAADRPTVGAVFLGKPFRRGAIVRSARLSGGTQVDFDDQEDLFKALALNFDFLDWRIRVWEAGISVAADGTAAITWITLKIAGRCEDAEWDVERDNRFVLDVGFDAAPRNIIGPREKYSFNCRFRFKSARCGYVGAETSCVRTWVRCGELLNQARYGGFRKLPTPGEKLPPWGATIATLQPRYVQTTHGVMQVW